MFAAYIHVPCVMQVKPVVLCKLYKGMFCDKVYQCNSNVT